MTNKLINFFTLIIIFVVLFFLDSFLFYSLINNYYQSQIQKRILTEIEGLRNQFYQFSQSEGPQIKKEISAEVKLADARVANLKSFFRKYNSPLYDYADLIVNISDRYGFDYRLLPAIAMQESTLCKFIPENSHNCWGYGIYGDQVLKFSSYEEAIETVAKGIKKNYIDHGLTTPELVMKKYTPSSPGTWARGVNYFFRLLE